MPNTSIKKNSWENLDLKTTKIPEIVRNSSDENVIASYLKNNKQKLSQKEIAFLTHRQQSMKLINSKIEEINKQIENNTYTEKKTTLKADPDKQSYILSDIKQPAFQTADFGCWSCFYQMLLQSRGITGITQEDIRAFRPTLSKDSEGFSKDSDEEMNKDMKVDAVDMGDLALKLVPDSMLKSTEIWSYNKLKNSNAGTPADKQTYFESVVKGVKDIIVKAIRDHHSPIGIMIDGHYVTITGIEGDVVSYKNSMPNEEAGKDPNFTHKKTITDLLRAPLNGENADALTLTWMEDITVLKSDVISNLPLPKVSLTKSHSMHDNNYTGLYKVRSKESQGFYVDDRRQNGQLLVSTGGIDIPDEDYEYRFHLKQGYYRTDKAYIPKRLNSDRLHQKALNRTNEEEAILNAEYDKRLDEITTMTGEIASLKLIKAADDPAPVINESPRFKVPIDKQTGRPFFGEGKTFYEFKQTLTSLGWDRGKYPILLAAFANIYDGYPFDKNQTHHQAMNELFTNTFAINDQAKNTITNLKNTLVSFLNSVENGDVIYSLDGQALRLLGLKYYNGIRKDTSISLQYLRIFIDTLEVIERFAPNLDPDTIDIESFIDVDGKIKEDEIYNNPVISAQNKNKITREEDGIRVSPKCKYKIKLGGFSNNFAEAELIKMDDIRPEERDKDLIFTYILTLAYPNPGGVNKPVVFKDEDIEYLSARYENDPKFAQNIDDLVKYGFTYTWISSEFLTNYVFRKERHLYGNNSAKELTPDEITAADQTFNMKIEDLKDKWSTLAESTSKYLDKEEKAFSSSFRAFRNDIITRDKAYDPVALDKAPKVNYLEAAKIIAGPTLPDYVATAPNVHDDNVNAMYESNFRKGVRKREELLKLKAINLVNSIDFIMYIKENVEVIPSLTKNDFISNYEDYKTAMINADSAALTDYTAFLNSMDNMLTKETIADSSKLIIGDASRNNEPFKRADMYKAADLVIAKTLLTKRADTVFYNTAMYENQIIPDAFKDQLKSARKELIDDPIFLQTFAKQLPAKDFYKEYTRALNAEANRKITLENARKKDIRKTRGEEDRINAILETNTHKITDKQAKELINAYNNMVAYNKGASPSSIMKKLMKAFKDVIDEMGPTRTNRNIQMMKLHKLNKYVLKYYDKRQGVFHDPYTDMGKARLKEIEKISNTTEKIVSKMREDHPEINKNSITVVKKNTL